MNREKKIIQTSIIGIIANVFLASFKAAVGLLSNSVAIVLDAVNNLSDALSSIITIVGTKLAAKAPDKDHPLGHGRYEYLTAMVIAVIVLYAGLTALIESVKKIIHPQTPDYSTLTLVVVAVAVVVKILLGTYVKKTGEKVNSDSLVASGTDAFFDSIISAATLVAAFIFIFSGLSLESYLGVIISLIILKSGYEILMDTISELLGKRIDTDLAKKVKSTVIESFDEVSGVYDLILHNYGPDRLVGSLHVSVPDKMTVRELDKLERNIAIKVFEETGVMLVGVSVYSINTESAESAKVEKKVREVCGAYKAVLEVHGFYLDEEEKNYRFDVIIDYDVKDRKAIYDRIVAELKEAFPQYEIFATLDADVSD